MNWYTKIKFAKTLYHGTSINNYNSIKNVGLIPDVGNFVRDSYEGEYDAAGVEFDPTPVTYAADKENLDTAITAMVYAVAKYLNKEYHNVTPDEIKSYGMLVLIRDGENYFQQRPQEETGPYRDWQGETDNRYPAVEPGDYYSEEGVIGDILFGNKLIEFLTRHGKWPLTWIGEGVEELRKLLLTMAINYHIKEHPELKDTLVKTIKDKIMNLDEESVKEYYRQYEKLINNK